MANKKLTEHLANLLSCHSNIKAIEASVIQCLGNYSDLDCHRALKAGEEQSGTCIWQCSSTVLKGALSSTFSLTQVLDSSSLFYFQNAYHECGHKFTSVWPVWTMMHFFL